jgi:transcription antitermination factor NusG
MSVSTKQLVSIPESSPLNRWDNVDSYARWFVLHVKSRQEKALSAELERSGIVHYLPLNRVVRYYGKRKVEVAEPLFAGYVFLKGQRESAFTADRTRRVASIISVPDQGRFERELAELAQALDRVGFLVPAKLLQPGVAVEVISGPFKGTIGHVTSLDERNRLVLHVSALGQGAALELNGSQVRPLEN